MTEKRQGRGPSMRGGGRYDPYEIVARVERRRVALSLTRTAVASAAGMDLSQYTHKASLRRNQFSTTELGLIADCFAAASREVLPGWPFIPEEQSRVLETALRDAREGGKTNGGTAKRGHLSSV